MLRRFKQCAYRTATTICRGCARITDREDTTADRLRHGCLRLLFVLCMAHLHPSPIPPTCYHAAAHMPSVVHAHTRAAKATKAHSATEYGGTYLAIVYIHCKQTTLDVAIGTCYDLSRSALCRAKVQNVWCIAAPCRCCQSICDSRPPPTACRRFLLACFRTTLQEESTGFWLYGENGRNI